MTTKRIKKSGKPKGFTITGAICRDCQDLVCSLFRHDFCECSCGKTFVDGGRYEKSQRHCGHGRGVLSSRKVLLKLDFPFGDLMARLEKLQKNGQHVEYSEFKDKIIKNLCQGHIFDFIAPV